jgi:hypothetical protein
MQNEWWYEVLPIRSTHVHLKTGISEKSQNVEDKQSVEETLRAQESADSHRSPVEEAARKSQLQILIEYRESKSNNSRVSYSLVSKEERHKKLYSILQGEETSTDRPDTRHQGVRIECNVRL